VVFTWNGTTSGVRVPNGDFIPADRKGLTICDATSAAFAQDLDFDKLDVVTFSWQKVLGGEGGHGVLILSPRAVERLESYVPAWPLPKIFRMTKGGKLIEGIFKGETINTPSMLCVEDYLDALTWAKTLGGLKGLIARADANAKAILTASWRLRLDRKPRKVDPATRSNTSVCLKIVDPAVTALDADAQAALPRRFPARQGRRGARHRRLSRCAFGPSDLGGATVETSDLEALMPWLDWAFETQKAALKAGRLIRFGRAEFRPAGSPSRFIPLKEAIMAPRVLVSDKLSETAVQIFRDRGVDVDFMNPKLGKDKEKLLEIIGDYDGLAIRSATKATEKLIAAATNLKVIGRAGIGVDNVDIPAASRRGIIVMNTPVRQLDHHRRTRHRHDVRRRPPAARGRRLHPGRQVGEVEVHGRRDHRQDARADRLRQYRLASSRPGDRAEDAGDRYDPFLSKERARNWA
jgi:hypothetical protein